MAVPSSGTLTMLGLARERKLGNYNSTVTLFYPILMTDLINGGGLNSFPALNTSSPYKKVGDRIDTITTRTNTSSDSKTNEENIIQKQYVKDLRTGKVGLADALLTQRTAGGYTGANTVNLKTFLAQSDEFADYNFEASGLSSLLDVMAYNTHYNSLLANFLGLRH